MMVMRRSRSFSTPRAAMIAVVVQPNPISMGMKERPDKPILRSSLSVMKAARDIYPESSRMDMNRKISRIWGKNTNTPPTPAMMPSITREYTHWGNTRI